MDAASSEGGPSEASTVRKRIPATEEKEKDLSTHRVNPSAEVRATSDESDAADAFIAGERISRLTKNLPRSTDTLGSYMEPVLNILPARWRNWVVRLVFTIFMVSMFYIIVKRGPTWLMALVFAIQFKCFHEIITIGLAVYRLYDLPWFRALSWYFLLSSNYFFFGESLIDYWSILLRKDEFLHFLVAHHRLISFALYCLGFVWFVLSLRKGYYMRQFSLFAWSHVTLLLIVSQSFLIIQNIFQGIIWFLVPVSMVICCDVMSYVFGFFFGRTPLIKLSPKKTWEGFIGGGISTVIFGLILSYILIPNPFFVCPVEDFYESNNNCTVPSSFQTREYAIGRPFSYLLKMLSSSSSVQVYPFLLHATMLGLFASILGPFGGFFASGFKRAFKIKDFGDVIPGHGGLMDRFDCQLLMGTFVNVYIHTFIRTPNAAKVLQQVSWLSAEEQLSVYHFLQDRLIADGVLPAIE